MEELGKPLKIVRNFRHIRRFCCNIFHLFSSILCFLPNILRLLRKILRAVPNIFCAFRRIRRIFRDPLGIFRCNVIQFAPTVFTCPVIYFAFAGTFFFAAMTYTGNLYQLLSGMITLMSRTELKEKLSISVGRSHLRTVRLQPSEANLNR
jgi:hypothetical protein